MANANSQQITDLIAGIKQRAGTMYGRVRLNHGTMPVGVPVVGDIYRMARVPTHAIPCGLFTFHDSLGAATTAGDLGFYTATPTPVAVDSDAITNEANLATAAGSSFPNDRTYDAVNVLRWGQRFWEWAGLAADPGGYLDIAWTMTVVATGTAGDLGWRFFYAVD